MHNHEPITHTCSLLLCSLPFTGGVEGTQVGRRGVVPIVAFLCFAQGVVGLIPRAYAITTEVNGSMHMFEGVWDSALGWHWVTTECYSVADAHQPPAHMQASLGDRNEIHAPFLAQVLVTLRSPGKQKEGEPETTALSPNKPHNQAASGCTSWAPLPPDVSLDLSRASPGDAYDIIRL